MSDQRAYWKDLYQSLGDQKPVYDLWLDKYAKVLRQSRDIPIIDLGCGFGNDSLYLYERGYKVISCDFSPEALQRLAFFIDKPVTKLFDMREGLPFESNSVKVCIADLSLQYFSWLKTQKIVAEIKRVLVKGGYLLARVNSVKDINPKTSLGVAIEENYYNINGCLKRFFDRGQLEHFFRAWEMKYINEHELDRYKRVKMLWEIAVEKQE